MIPARGPQTMFFRIIVVEIIVVEIIVVEIIVVEIMGLGT